ncbi:hypothetical protein ACW73L_15860 [Methylolobus aquaticus]
MFQHAPRSEIQAGAESFGATLLRQALFAVFRVAEGEETHAGMIWLNAEIADWEAPRETLIALLRYRR